MSWDVDEKEFYETFAEIESERGIEEAKQWVWSALDWTQKELRKKEDGVKDERAAVVVWLRKEAVSHRRDGFPIAAYTMQERADAIERGEHRREEEK